MLERAQVATTHINHSYLLRLACFLDWRHLARKASTFDYDYHHYHFNTTLEEEDIRI